MSRRTGIGLTRDRVVQAGLRLVDRDGVEALTMRRLGRELGVEAMSLYGYVDNKQDLLEAVLACVHAEMPTVDPSGPWPQRLRAIAGGFRAALLRHPNIVGLVAARPVTNQAGVHMVESTLAALRDAGLDLVQANQALNVVVGFTLGHVADQVGAEKLVGTGEAAVDGLDRERFPNVTERALLDGDHDAEFEVGLDVIVAGISRLADPMPV